MYSEEFRGMAAVASTKNKLFMDNKMGFFISCMLAGLFIGFGVVSSNMAGFQTAGMPYSRLIMSITFVAALSIVVMAGSELFTGNTMVIYAGILNKTVPAFNAGKLLLLCYIGNLAGSVLLAFMFVGTQIPSGEAGAFFVHSAAAKMAIPVLPLLLRSILCNMLVCLAVWCTYRCKTESGKLIMIFWCISSFVIAGFEHSIANMSLLTIGMLIDNGSKLSWGGYFYNLSVVTIGNMIGAALFITYPYYLIGKSKK